MPFISVIIPTYNRKDLLLRAINSVRNQTYTDYELIVVDDASDDGTGDMEIFAGQPSLPEAAISPRSSLKGFGKCEDASAADPFQFIRFFRFPLHRGVSVARNFGVSQSKGAWICFLDSDDVWHKDKLEKQVRWLNAHGEFRIFQTREIWMRNGVRVNPPKTHLKIHGRQFKENLERCMITPSSVMIEKTLFIETGGFNESLPACEDYDLWLRITRAYPVGLLDEALLIRYGGRDDQLSSSVPILDRFRIRSILDCLNAKKLSSEQIELAREQLVKKAMIVAHGYKKRGKKDFYEFYLRLAEKYRR